MSDIMDHITGTASDAVSAKIGQPAQSRAETGRIYPGTIINASHGDNIYVVALDGFTNLTLECRWSAGLFAPLVGMRTMYYPPVQSRVLILVTSSSPHYIVSSTPSEQYIGSEARTKTMTGIPTYELDPYKVRQKGRGLQINKPNDLLEGEFDISNNFGVSLQLLTTLASMKGSERAKVEAFLLNDMVRIVSDTFKQFSCFGDYQIYNDGRLNARWDGTSYSFEAWGLATPEEAKAKIDNKKVDYQKSFNETGRWRFSQYVGFLGDFIHMFITEPNSTLAGIAEEALRPGKSRIHANSDGSILIQSVADIAIERVIRVINPVEKKRYDDPGGNVVEDFKSLNNDFLKLWNYGTDLRNAHYTSYQLRQYARWLSCFHSYARFHQLDKDWSIPLETNEDTQQSWTNQEQDVEAANAASPTYQDVYATIRIMRDGAIVVLDSFGSAISMVRGNVQISSARHLELDAAGDIKITAGQNLYIKARRNIELVSIVGGLTLKARTWWKGLCEWGSIWIKSDAEDPSKPGYSPKTPVDAQQDPAPEVRASAVCLEASQGQILVQSDRMTTISALGTPDDAGDIADTTASVVIQSQRQDVRTLAGRNNIIKATGLGSSSSRIILDAEQAQAVIMKCSKFLVKAFLVDINKKFTLKYSTLHLDEVRSNRAHFSTVVTGPKMQGVDIALAPPYAPHGNHMLNFVDTNTPIETGGDTTYLDDYNSGDVKEVPMPDDPDWAFVDETKVYDDSGYVNEPMQDEVFQPMAQQRLDETETDNLINKADYNTWLFDSGNKLQAAPRTNPTSVPFPGVEAKEKIHSAGTPLHVKLPAPYSEQSPDKAEGLIDRNVQRKYLKLK